MPLEQIDDLDDLVITVDEERTDDTTDRDARTLERALSGVVERQIAASRSAPINMRLVNLETWRLEVDKERIRLFGIGGDAGGGKLERLTTAIDELRDDVGDRDECKRVRASADLVDLGRKRAIAAVIAAGLALGGAGWAMVRSARREATEETLKRMELELRVRNNERRLEQIERRAP